MYASAAVDLVAPSHFVSHHPILISTCSVTISPPFERMSWEQLVSKKKESLRDSIPQEWRLNPDVLASLTETGNSRLMALDPVRKSGILNDLEIEITEKYSAAQLVSRMARGDLKAVEVVTAFCKRAAIAQQLVSETQLTFGRSCF